MKKIKNKISILLSLLLLVTSLASPVKVIGQILVNKGEVADELEGRDRSSEILIEEIDSEKHLREEDEDGEEENIEESESNSNEVLEDEENIEAEEENNDNEDSNEEYTNEEEIEDEDDKKELATIYVDIEAEEGGDGSEEKPLQSIGDAINLANKSQEKVNIYLYRGDYDLNEGRVILNNDIRIIGEGINRGQGENHNYLVNISIGDSLTIAEEDKNKDYSLTFENLNFKDQLSKIEVISSNLRLENISLEDRELVRDTEINYISPALELIDSGKVEVFNVENLGNISGFGQELLMTGVDMGYEVFIIDRNNGDYKRFSSAGIELDYLNRIELKDIKNLGPIYTTNSNIKMLDIEMGYDLFYYNLFGDKHYSSANIETIDGQSNLKNIKI